MFINMRIVFLFLFFLPFLRLQAQEAIAWRFDRFTQEDGLSNNQVHCIFQDSQGWMWFGTTYGLNRFDGRNFKIFKNDASDTLSLSTNLVRDIFEDSRGMLWVGLEYGGLCRYDWNKEVFLRYREREIVSSSVNHITEDNDGNLWLATDQGLVRMRWIGEERFEVERVPLSFSSSYIRKILVDKHANLWIGTDQGLFVYDLVRNKLSHLELPETEYTNDDIWALYADENDRVWIGAYHSGLYYVNPWESNVVRSSFTPNMYRAKTIRAIVKDSSGRFWLGTRAGLFSFDGKHYEYHRLGGGEEDMSSILSLCVDAKGDLWIGSRQGISYFVKEKQFIHLYTASGYTEGASLNNGEVYSFLCEGNTVWIGTELGGVNKLDRTTGKFTYYTLQSPGLSSNCIKSFLRDGDELWLGTFMGGISVLNTRTGRVVRTFRALGKPGNLEDDRVWTLFKDREGTIWVGHSHGIEQYDRKRNVFVKRNDVSRDDSQVNWITQDTHGDLWIGCESKLLIYSPEHKKTKYYFRKTRSMVEFSDQDYYVTTVDGLAHFDKERGFHHFYTEKDGLISNYTLGALAGTDSTLWISTTNGLSLFDLKTQTFKNFDKKDGLQDNQFNYGAYLKNDRGELFFGGINGFNIIVPELVKNNEYVPPIVITNLKIFNENAEVGEGKLLTKHIAFTDKVRLRYDQNMLSFSFTALNYVMAEKNRYRYRLEGLEERWVDAGHTTTATYANLASGNYVFHVLGSNNDGVWNEEGASLHVVIVPPFWQRWWFICLISLMLLFIGGMLVRFYVSRQTIKNRLLLEKTQARKLHEVDMMKLQFFTNVSHEIRTPLTLIIGPVEKLWRQIKEEDIRTQLGIVYRNASKLMELINQLLDFRKLEVGKYNVDYRNGDIVRFLSGITESFRYSANEKGITLTFCSNQVRSIMAFDADKMEKIVNNLLSNALKFTDRNGSIVVNLNIEEEAYEVSVQDSGIGIAASDLPLVFNRFFQSPRSGEVTGTGIGLSITKSFVELMGGSIDVKSEKGKETMFTVRLPLCKDFRTEEVESVRSIGKYLLVVDDNEDIRMFIKTHFKSSFNVLEASDGKEGCEIALKHVPDIIVVDMLMPVMDGYEMCKKLKRDERTSHIPIIMLTAVTSKEKKLDNLLTGIDDYITKPFDVDILTVKIDNLLQIRNTLREKIKHDWLLQPEDVVLDSPDDKFLKRAVSVVEKFMDDPELDIGKFSEEMRVSRMQLYRKFEALTNMTVKEFIRSVRLKRAAQMLRQEKLTVSEVAWTVGFKDMSYFRKCFKEEFGMTPTEYTEKMKNEK
ncbi:Sensor histidine kinase TodS [termite gut metagenome]|uniref:histidine kinase n=1 Tax=termite gut metagenome TaxID=433724 RepID=A0A5J4RAT0_9ZZZZ